MTRTVGVEEEFLLLRKSTTRLAPVGDAAVSAADEGSDGQFEHEFKREQAETGTKPQSSVARLGTELRLRRAELAEGAAQQGARLAALATSPLDVRSHPTPSERYAEMGALFGRVAETQLTCGMHVHVSIDSPDEGVGAIDRLRPWLAVLVALTASSPYLGGADTGYASFRSVMWGQWPTAGVTESFGDWAGYSAARKALVASGAALDEAMIYFDARMSARYPTVEVRVCDVCPYAEDAITIAALIRAMVSTAAADWASGKPAPVIRSELLRAAGWRAGRWGLEGELVDCVRVRAVPAWDLVGDLLEWVAPALAETGDAELVGVGLTTIRERGNGATLQRNAFASGGRWNDVVDAVVAATLA